MLGRGGSACLITYRLDLIFIKFTLGTAFVSSHAHMYISGIARKSSMIFEGILQLRILRGQCISYLLLMFTAHISTFYNTI